jgi:hypothetical protein
MFGGLEGTRDELLFVDNKMYPRRKVEKIKKLIDELDEEDLKEWLIRDILKPKRERGFGTGKQKKEETVEQYKLRKMNKILEQIEKEIGVAHTHFSGLIPQNETIDPVVSRFDKLLEEFAPKNTIIEDFKSPAQKEFAVSEAIKVANKRGRKPKYATEEERKIAKREKTIASNKRKREERMHAKDIQNQLDADERSDEDFPLNTILEPAKKRKTKGGGIKEIVKTKLGEVVRGDIVARVMRKMGLSLPEASKYVKLHNLY